VVVVSQQDQSLDQFLFKEIMDRTLLHLELQQSVAVAVVAIIRLQVPVVDQVVEQVDSRMELCLVVQELEVKDLLVEEL
jgi:hypothetical protein